MTQYQKHLRANRRRRITRRIGELQMDARSEASRPMPIQANIDQVSAHIFRLMARDQELHLQSV